MQRPTDPDTRRSLSYALGVPKARPLQVPQPLAHPFLAPVLFTSGLGLPAPASSRCPDVLPGDIASFQERVPRHCRGRKTPKRSLHPSAILEPKSWKVPEPSSGVGVDPKHQRNAGHSVAAICMFRAVLHGLGDFSALHVQLRTAVHADDHVCRLLSGFAASTVVRYVGAWNSLLQTLQDLGHLACLTEPLLADCLVAASLSKRADTCSGCCAATAIKAVRWLCRVAQVELLEIAYAPLIDSFLKSKIARDRKEAYLLPQCVLRHWERRILDRRSSQSEVLTLGGFLMLGPRSGLRMLSGSNSHPCFWTPMP